ncbi:N-acetylmuramoyl-L-alanine amidase [Cellulosimicrobium cellulans]|uniref:N-acetylmuramoyl-L-alanine amidase n=1 Tax=Cellulosimicrobium cellulans TaxID=1710 RepID=UPI0038132633
MPRVTRLPAALAARGLTVELADGWATRGSADFDPKGAVCHWTAGARTGDRPSLKVVRDGRAGLPGPLANVFLARSGVVVVVAAGRANHAGVGGWRGLVGNSKVFGTEAESAGDGDWTEAQRWAYPRINAAFCDLGGFGPEMVCGHNEWAPTRKIDIRDWDMARMRREVASVLEGDDMPLTDKDLEKIGTEVWKRPVKDADGKTITAGQALQRVVQLGLAKQGADETWTRQVTAPDGTKVAVGAAVQATLRHAYDAARDAAVARQVSEQQAAAGRALTEDEIARVAEEVADRVQAITAADVAAQLVITTTPKETP